MGVQESGRLEQVVFPQQNSPMSTKDPLIRPLRLGSRRQRHSDRFSLTPNKLWAKRTLNIIEEVKLQTPWKQYAKSSKN